jgi:hypothetical protein
MFSFVLFYVVTMRWHTHGCEPLLAGWMSYNGAMMMNNPALTSAMQHHVTSTSTNTFSTLSIAITAMPTLDNTTNE